MNIISENESYNNMLEDEQNDKHTTSPSAYRNLNTNEARD